MISAQVALFYSLFVMLGGLGGFAFVLGLRHA
jgi:hypothetical protein